MKSRLEIIYPLSFSSSEDGSGLPRRGKARAALYASYTACSCRQELKSERLPQLVCDKHKRSPSRIERPQARPNFRAPNRIRVNSEVPHCTRDGGYNDKDLLQSEFGRPVLLHRK